MAGVRDVVRGPVAAVLLVVGCSGPPHKVMWREDVEVLRPAPKEVGKGTDGYLEVETAPLPPGPDEDTPHYQPFYVYTDEGRFIVDGRWGRALLKPGKYIVVSRVRGSNRQVQVIVEAGHATHVSKKDFEAGFSVEQ